MMHNTSIKKLESSATKIGIFEWIYVMKVMHGKVNKEIKDRTVKPNFLVWTCFLDITFAKDSRHARTAGNIV